MIDQAASDPSSAIAPAGDPFRVRMVAAEQQRAGKHVAGRRTQTFNTPRGHVVGATIPQRPLTRIGDVALIPTLQTAVRRQLKTKSAGQTNVTLEQSDLRSKVRVSRAPNLVLFVVDASGSMAARQRMTAVKGAVLSLLLDAYQKRDSVGMIAFRGAGASLLLPPTRSVSLAQQHLVQLPTGGRTPLVEGLRLAHRVLYQYTRRAEAHMPLLVLVSDGRANVGGARPLDEALAAARQIRGRGWSSLVIDCENGYPRLGLAAQVGRALRGETIQLEKLSAEGVATAVRGRLSS